MRCALCLLAVCTSAFAGELIHEIVGAEFATAMVTVWLIVDEVAPAESTAWAV